MKYIIIFLIIISLSLSLCGCGSSEMNKDAGLLSTDKAPYGYTWDEFENLSPDEQIEFQQSFESPEEFEEWMDEATTEATDAPWEKENKQPSDYTLEEFEALSGKEQIEFQQSFESPEEFEEWMNEATTEVAGAPWEEENRQPSDYTLGEFKELSADEQLEFQQSFESPEKFEEWMNEATTEAADTPREEENKQPSDYTREEYEALSPEKQMEFQNSFDNPDEFEKWFNEAHNEKAVRPWDEKGAKQPSEYTWGEFEALSAKDQIAFQQSFEEYDDFMKWLTANKNDYEY